MRRSGLTGGHKRFRFLTDELDPYVAVEDEGRLNDAELRETFVERVFAAARLRAMLSREWERRDLVEFHARHKLQLLAHDPARYRSLGRVVAAAGSAADYRELLLAALAGRATWGRNANALLHAYSRIGRMLGAPRRSDLAASWPLRLPCALCSPGQPDETTDSNSWMPQPDG